jgi:DNA-binding transcriptional regulator YiaG
MANLAKVLKEEICRLARKEIRSELATQQKTISKLKQDISVLKKQLSEQQRINKALLKNTGSATDEVLTPAADASTTTKRFTGKGVRGMRKKLGLSQTDFAKLAGVTLQSVYQWEHRNGPLKLRTKAHAGLVKVSNMGRREALATLSQNSKD